MTPEDIVAATLDAGWDGVPVGENSKVSLTRWNVRAFTRDALLHHVRRGGNFAVKAGRTKSGVTAVAIDRDARDMESWRTFVQRHDIARRCNMSVTTASMNQHYWFRVGAEIDGLRTKIKLTVNGRRLPVDVKSSGYVMFPPSAIGRPYAFRETKGLKRPEDLEPLPGSVVELLKKRKEVKAQPVFEVPEGRYGRYAEAAMRREAHTVATAEEGTRNDTLNRAAFSLGGLVAVGLLRRETVEAALIEAATAAGLGEREIVATVTSGLAAGLKRPRALPK